MGKFDRLVSFIEGVDIPLVHFLCIFASIDILRYLLEVVFLVRDVTYTHAFFQLFLFFIPPFLLVSIVLHLLTREEIKKVTTVCLFAFSLIVLPPLMDSLIFHREVPVCTSCPLSNETTGKYLYAGANGKWEGVSPLYDLLTFYATNPAPGKGILLVGAIFMILSFLYTYSKTKDLVRSITAFFSIWLVYYFFGAFPYFVPALSPIVGTSGAQNFYSGLYVFLSFILTLFWFFFHNKKKLIAAFGLLRPLRLGHFILMVIVGAWLGGLGSLYKLLLAGFSIGLAWQFAVVVNDIYDALPDKINRLNRPYSKNVLKIGDMWVVAILIAMFSLVSGLIVSEKNFAFLAILLYLLLGILYSAPPIRLKRYPIIATSVIGLASALSLFTGYVTQTTSINPSASIFLIVVFVSISLATTVKDVKDTEGDRAVGDYTLPVLLGQKQGANVAKTLLIIAYLFSAILTGTLEQFLIAAAFAILSIEIMAHTKEYYPKIILLYYIYLVYLVYLAPKLVV